MKFLILLYLSFMSPFLFAQEHLEKKKAHTMNLDIGKEKYKKLKEGGKYKFSFDVKEKVPAFKEACFFFKFKHDLFDPGETIKLGFKSDDKGGDAGQIWPNSGKRSISYRSICYSMRQRIGLFFLDGKNEFTLTMEKGTAKLAGISLLILLPEE